MSSKIVSLRLDFGTGNPVPVFGHVCGWWKWKQPIEEGHKVQVVGRWTCADRSGMKAYPFVYPVTLVCHLLTGGPLGFLVLDDKAASAQEKKAMEAEFSTCKNDNKALVVLEQLPGGRRCEFLLAPIIGHTRGESVGVFGVYATSMKCGHFLLSRVIRKERIPLILDLDETLVKAHTINQLEKKYESSNATNAQKRARLSKIEKDCDNLLYKDRLWIKRFAETEDMVVGNVTYKARNVHGMYSSHDGNTFRDIIRPVIDLQFVPEDTHKKHPLTENMFLTKILADQKQTTVLARTRPGWRDAYDKLARATLSGEDEPRLAVEVFIATTAEKNYAHEVWRALDFESVLIPETERSERIVAGMDKKNLAKSLRCLNPNPLVNPMNLAIILDDRTDVWDRLYHKQILKSDVYDPYSPDHSDSARMKDQMEHFVDVILEARNQFFSFLKRQGLLLFGDSHPYKEFDVDCLEEEYFANLGSIPTMSDILAQILDTKTDQETFERIQPCMLPGIASEIKTPSDPRRRHVPIKQENADLESDAKQQVFNPSTDIFHEPEMADVPQMADTDPNMTIVALQKEDRSIEEIGQAASDVMSRETCTQGGSLNSHPQVNKSTHERMNELASTMGYIISSKCEWLDGINTATISIVDPRARTESEKKGLLIGMCSGVDAMTAVAGASESGLKYLENMAALKRAVGDSQGPVKAPLDDVEAGLEMPDNVQVGRKSKWDMRPEPAPTSQEHNQSDNNHDESMQCEVEKKPAEQAKKEEAATRPSGTKDDKKQSGTPTKRETTSRSSKEEPKHATGSKKKEEEEKPRPITRQVEKKPAEQAKKEAAQRPSETKDDKKQSGTPTKRETTSRSSKEEPKHATGSKKKEEEEKPRPMTRQVEKKPAEQAKKEEAATRPSETKDDKKQSGTPTKRETTSRSSKEEPKHATGSKKKEEEEKPRPMTRQVEKKPAEQAKKEAAQRPSGTKDDKKQSGTPTKRETTSQSSKEEPKHSMGPMKKTEEKPRPMKREIERNTTPSKRARYSDEKGRGGSPWGSGSRLDNEIYSEVDGRIRCHLCKNSFPSGKYYLDKHDRGRRHQEKLRETSRKRTIRQPLDSEGEQSPRTWTNTYVVQCRESLDEIRRKCGNTARGMGVKLLPGSPYFSKGHFEARIQGEASSERVRFGKRTLGFGQGSTRNEALIDAYEKSFDELTRVRDQENQRKRKKNPRTHDSGHQGDSLGQPNFSFNIQ
ncbi:hypothetical protein M9434_001582 [Picochlorum sp. BPE23]|nr:hypothetical protein M9434_001582 [Picochlorum sp. BPE23]